ncbi:YbhB/YbcL family Raf kinase inhibitor-like protein [Legionella anisa]|uniref:YbhB/YbcL family Raf kinase inhibitor-like protein n=1 Tax=Legionella anisa TaxID=28082 RepID=A0AAX0WU47_9GAMM|nr:YbhB/YbcL family Raf kinase inhibitor-like protein [Legionella anisa]KTC76332.1 phosphatidylethanolamine-binding protein [Legionella anisa]MBN5935946.1 YbhB/YbcL family Raf kinase inhibitor-like protein [Legionella anisa]PNL60544.1 YbhB/YbcL family Raf kinase inhibitor-like protein [Legionella anisa]UAK80694.1 YbhB/YbcL family Raf kinase inhibitor-like protein [Legionella anisa]
MKKYSLFLFLMCSLFHYNAFANKFTLESSAFKMNSLIPDEFTCTGVDQSPPLAWRNIPPKTQSLALIVDDPDSPNGGVWTHWIVFNIPPTVKELEAGSPVPPGAANAKNSWDGLGYRGPCPPIGIAHTYHFKLYALDTVLSLGDGTTRDILLNAMTGHVIGEAELVGIYQKFNSNTPAQ